ncbi:MAG: MBL fold metallo-hydrolase [bacterium]
MAKIEQFWLFHCGYAKIPKFLFEKGGGSRQGKLPMMAALLVHDELGPVLIDAPFGPEGPSNTGELLGAILRRTGVVFKPEWAIVPRIEQLGFRASEINHVLMTHLHFDHTGGMKSVAHARFHIDRDEWMSASGMKPLEAARAGYVVGDFRALAPRIEKMDLSQATIESGFDVFGDGTVEAVPLRGHSIGHTGFRCRVGDAEIFYVGDAVYAYSQIAKPRGFSPFAKSAAYDLNQASETAEGLRTWFGQHPDAVFANAHDFDLGESCMGGPRALHPSV